MENHIQSGNFREIISISDFSRVRKHRQIVNSVLSAKKMGYLGLNDKLPSVNELAFDYNVSRDTVVRAYAFLKQNNIIESIPGKGYYMRSSGDESQIKVFLLFSRLGPKQKEIFDGLNAILNEYALIELYVYQNSFEQFKKHILNSRNKEFTHYVLDAGFDREADEAAQFIRKEIPLDKLVMLDKKMDGFGNVRGIYQDFENDIFNALAQLRPQLQKYRKIKLVCPESSSMPQGIKDGFSRFCREFRYQAGLVQDLAAEKMERQTVYINIEENDLTVLVKEIKKNGFAAGQDIGIISYNDSNLKEILLDGITVIATDFRQAGEQAALMILRNEKQVIASRSSVIIRKSL